MSLESGDETSKMFMTVLGEVARIPSDIVWWCSHFGYYHESLKKKKSLAHTNQGIFQQRYTLTKVHTKLDAYVLIRPRQWAAQTPTVSTCFCCHHHLSPPALPVSLFVSINTILNHHHYHYLSILSSPSFTTTTITTCLYCHHPPSPPLPFFNSSLVIHCYHHHYQRQSWGKSGGNWYFP